MAVSPPPVSISLSYSLPPSSPGAGPSTHSSEQPHPPNKTFRRLRTSLEHTIRAAAGSRTRKDHQQHSEPHPQLTASSAPPSAPSPPSRILDRRVKHKHSASDTALPPPPPLPSSDMSPPAPSPKGKQRVSVDFVGVERSRDRERERERISLEKDRERAAGAGTTGERTTSSRFSAGVGGGLRKLESKVGLRRHSSREVARSDAPSPTPSSSSPPPPPMSISGPAKLRRERDRTVKDREKVREEPPSRTRSKSAWSFLVAPSLSSHPSASTSALDVSTLTSSTEHAARTREREHETDAVRVSAPSPSPPPRTSARSPPSPTPPIRISPTASRSRVKLMSPSSPSLSSPTSSSSQNTINSASTPTTTPSPGIPSGPSSPSALTPLTSSVSPRTRQRPSPLKATPPSAGPSSTTSSSTHTVSRSNTTPTPRSVPPSPTTPTNIGSQAQTPRNVSPIPALRPSRPPLSPSANANAASRLRLRTGVTPAASKGLRSASTTSLPMEPSSISSSSTLPDKGERDRSERPERSERRRPSGGSTTTGTGRSTPTTGLPSHAAPTSSSRARTDSTREWSTERERERQQQQQAQTRSRASASASSLPLSRAEAGRSRSPSQSGSGSGVARRATSPAPVPALPPGHRDVIRHAASLLLRELNGPRPRALPHSTSSPGSSSSQPSLPLQALFPSSASVPALPQEALTPEVWDECEARLRLLARAERVRLGGPYGGSAVSLVGAGAVVGSATVASEERERRVFAEAVRDGYVLCQLVNKLRPGTIPRVDAYEDGFKSSSNATKFLAAAAGAFGIPASDLFHRDDLIKSAPDALLRVARTIVAVVARAGEDAAAERVARKILLGGGGGGGQSKEWKQPANSPYGTRAKGASSSTPNLSTLQRSASPPALGVKPSSKKKRWSPPSPALSTVAAEDTGSGTVSPERATSSKAGSASGKQARGESRKSGKGSRSGSGESVNTQTQVAKTSPPLERRLEDESALATDSEVDSDEDDANETFYDMSSSKESEKPRSTSAAPPAVPPKPTLSPSRPIPGRASLASETTQTTQSTAPSSLLAVSRPRDSSGAGDRASTQFGTMRTATTVATSVALSESYRADVSIQGSASEASVSLWDEFSGSPQSSNSVVAPLLKKPPLRDRRRSEAAINDLSRVAEETEEGTTHGSSSAGNEFDKGKPHAIQLGKGKWPEDFVQAFKPGSPARPIAFHRAETERVLSSSPLAASPPQLPSHLLGNVQGNDSAESLPQLPQRRPLHRPRHSVDAPVLRPRDPSFGRDREASPGSEGVAVPRIVPKKSNSTNRHGMYIPRGDSASPSTSADVPASTRVPFPRAVSGEHASPSSPAPVSGLGPGGVEVSATTAAGASGAQQSRFARGRFQSDVDAGSRRRPRPNSYDELGAKPHRSRIESMVSIGGASSSNFSASDIRSSMDGSAMRKTLIIRDEGKHTTHFQLGNCIGRGQFGSVYRALNLNTGQMVAVKRIRLEGLSEEDVKQLMREVDMVKSLSHPSIVKYEGMSRDSDTLNIVLEYAENGSLGQTLKAFGKLNEKLVATYVIKILEGLDYLHRNDVVHCDLKAANILTTKNGNVKLSDFGVSLNLRKVGRDHKSDVTGTPNWMAPEVIELKGASRASDIWSLGCTVIELLTGRPPYADILNGMSVMYRIVDDPMPPIPDEWSPLLKDFLQECFQRDPADRPTAEILSGHQWLKEHCDVHRVIRPKDSIPFLRRVSQELQQRPDVVRFLHVGDGPRSDSRASDRPRRSEDRPASPATSGTPGSPPKQRLSTGPATPKSPESDVSIDREHTFVGTEFKKPLLCRVCMQSVQKPAVVCGECGLIAHTSCASTAPRTCGIRAQLLQIANYTPSPDSPNALEIFRQLTPSASPVPEAILVSQHTTTPSTSEVSPPTAFRMFNAFRRSRSSLTSDPDRKRKTSVSATSGEGSNESILTSQATPQVSVRPRRPTLLLKPAHARPISTSSGDNLTPNRGSQRSGETTGSIDLSDESYSQAHSHSHSHSQSHSASYTYSRSQTALPSPSQVLARSRGASGAATPLGFNMDGETETEAELGMRYAPSRLSIAASAADSVDPRRESVLAGPSVGGSYDDHEDDELEQQLHRTSERGWRLGTSRRHGTRPSAGGDKEKGCVLQ